MDRFLVPRLGLVLVLGLATLLIGVIVLRSPDTHGNLWNRVKPGYARTTVATLGGEVAFGMPGGLALHSPGVLWQGASPMDPGRRAYLGAGCATCHGLDATGAVVGTSLAGADPEITKNVVRNGPGGMPAFAKSQLSDDDLDKLTAYLQGLGTAMPSAGEMTTLSQLSYDPSVPLDVLLKGKAALRRSCGACHTPPSKEEMMGGFDVGSLLATMVQQTNLSLEDAKLIGYYILAIRNGADPLAEP